jgi:hypothetical protein
VVTPRTPGIRTAPRSGPASRRRGKRLLGLTVERLDGGAPDARTAWLRHGLRTMSMLLGRLGYATAAITERRKALHDLLTETARAQPRAAAARARLGAVRGTAPARGGRARVRLARRLSYAAGARRRHAVRASGSR